MDANKDLVPYLSVGAGMININYDRGESENDALVNYGGGIKYFYHKIPGCPRRSPAYH